MKKKQNVNCKNPNRNYLGLLINYFRVHLFATYANSRRQEPSYFHYYFFFAPQKCLCSKLRERKSAMVYTDITATLRFGIFKTAWGNCAKSGSHAYMAAWISITNSARSALCVFTQNWRIPWIKRVTHGGSLYGLLLTAISIYSQCCQGNSPL